MPRVTLRLAGALALVVLIALSGPALAAPSAKLAQARDAFRRGDYGQAVPRLTALLYPKPQLSRRTELAEVHLMLAVCYFETGNRDQAGDEFERALEQQPDLELDPLFVTEEAVEYFEERKRAFEKEAALDAARRKLAEENALLRRAYERGLVREKRSYFVNFIPFGAGQFQNGQNRKGVFFASAQAVTGAASLAIWTFHAFKYNLNGSVPRDEAAGVRRLQQLQIVAGGTCIILIGVGIIDSLINYKHEVPVDFDPSLLKDSLEPDPEPAASLRIYPAPMPGGAGFTLSLDF